jgi:membrane-bound lytic murein transglycosylase D
LERVKPLNTLKHIFLNILFLLLAHSLAAQKPAPEPSQSDDYYLNFWKQNLDSLNECAQNTLHFDPISPMRNIPGYAKKNYKELIAQLNSDIPLQYDNRVGDILSFYIQNGEKTSFAIAYSNYLSKKFSVELEKAGLPKSLRYIPLALSAMNKKALSKAGAMGLWQLRYSAARKEGLVINSYVDERRNIQKSTLAALAELKQLYSLYKNWDLTLGAFACGPSNINKSIRRVNNQMDYYVIYPLLPDFGRDIVPALTAAALISQHPEEFGLKIPEIDFTIDVDTLEVSQRLHFVQLNKVIGIPLDTLRFLNPKYKNDIVPAINKVYDIMIPKGYLAAFNQMEDSIYHYQDSLLFKLKKSVILPPASKERHYAKYEPERIPDGSALVYYHIKSGDNLGYIASWYGVKSSQIEDWNNVYDPRRLQIGKRLKIYVPDEKEDYYRAFDDLSFQEKQKRIGKTTSSSSSKSASKPKKEEPLGKNWFYHTVRSGESPYLIAKKYKGVSADDILRWNNITNPKNIRPGQKLKIKKQ